jgi:hypothetical protein
LENRKFLTKKRVLMTLFLIYFFSPVWASTLVGLLRAGFNPDEQWILFHGSEFKGRVIDAVNQEPIEGAVVIAEWRTWQIWGAGSVPVNLIVLMSPLAWIDPCIVLSNMFGTGKTIVAETDKDGLYETPSWWSFQPWAYSDMGSAAGKITIYKPGHKIWQYKGKRVIDAQDSTDQVLQTRLLNSETAEEIEKDFENFCIHGFDLIPERERIMVASMIVKNLSDVPTQSKKKIQKHISP